MSERSIRSKYIPSFRNLSKKTVIQSGFILIGYITQIFISVLIGIYFSYANTPYALIAIPLLAIFIATRFRGLNNIIHECCHFSFVSNRKWNLIYGKIAAAFIFKSYEDYYREHLTHHAHLGNYEKDLDFQRVKKYKLDAPLTTKMVVRHIFTPIFGLHLTRYFSLNLTAKDGLGFAWLKLFLIIAIIVFSLFNFTAAIFLIVIPFAWVFTAVNYWTDCIDHAGLLGKMGDLKQARNIRMPRPFSWVIFPRNDCYHLVHHLFPTVPVHHFNTCHNLLMEDNDYRARHEEK